ncbi:CotH kinase family protein [Paenibacillus sp. N4]|uniref:CotH kinase family protein n=1 Tax=Paenibacillus vietnamensis TaxID=2590547 RepID=UPI001CD15663|nr:CotH kinase family protein [Paenibacillus vietnamensis]MCA0755158.1 CotH kinase family protein [Paenibacillus vietnamensis]
MKAKAKAWLLGCCSFLLLTGLTGCAADGTSFGLASLEALARGTAPSEDEQLLDETVFPKDKVVDVKITIDPDEFQDMLDNASAEEMHEAAVEYNGQRFENVGIRTKGNLSLNSVVRMADSDRYSFKISFDEYVSQTLAGISKINLNNNYSDASYMREFLSYELAETMGLPTPKYSYVNVYVNGELWGFYLAVEQIGDAYLERNFGNSFGALYKANGGAGSELNWLETIGAYTGLDLKSEKSNGDILLDMLDELNNGTDYENVLNVEGALKYIALNAVAGNFDSYLSEKKHNFYLYEDNGIFNILPWDYNMSFGGFGGTGVLIDEPTTGALADRPLIAKLLQVEEYKELYHGIIADMLKGYLKGETFDARIAELQAMISPYVDADPSAFYTYEQYEQGIQQVISFNEQQTASIAKQLDGTIPSAGDGSGTASGGFGGGGMGGMDGGFGGGRGGRQQMQQQMQPQQGQQEQQEQQNTGAAGSAEAAAWNGAAGGTIVAAAVVEEPAAESGADAEAGAANSQDAGANGGGAAMPGNTDATAGGGTDANANGDAAAPNAQGGGVAPADGQFPDGGQMPPDGQFPGGQGGFGGGARPDGIGMGGGFGGGAPGAAAAQPQGTPEEAATAGIAIALLLLSCVFVVFYKRKRL